VDRSREDPPNGQAWLDQLAPLHASVLRLASQGSDSEAIAACLGVPVESVPGLVEMAAAKLARIARERGAS
jgi:hypothetical protein